MGTPSIDAPTFYLFPGTESIAMDGDAAQLHRIPVGAAIGTPIGALQYFIKNEAGSTAVEMLNKGYDPKLIKKLAPVAGALPPPGLDSGSR